MKKDDILIMAAAAGAVFLFYQYLARQRQPATSAVQTPAKQDFATLFQQWQGWQYFTDGTVISPEGCYYSGGQKVWCP